MINPDHTPYVDQDGWLIPGVCMLNKNDNVSVSSDIENGPGINREYAKALSGLKGKVIEEKIISYHTLTGSSVLIRFDTPMPNPDGSETFWEAFWVPRKYVYQYQEAK
jgi:hypothetical protein